MVVATVCHNDDCKAGVVSYLRTDRRSSSWRGVRWPAAAGHGLHNPITFESLHYLEINISDRQIAHYSLI